MAFSLPTMAELRRHWQACPKGQSRLQIKHQALQAERRHEARWRREIWARDQGRDRLTKRKVKRTIELLPLRGECHHVEPRGNHAVRFDRRNGILLSLETHQRVERHEITIVGTRFFMVNGQRYIDCDHPVTFVKGSP